MLSVTALRREEELPVDWQGAQKQKKGGNCRGGQNQRGAEPRALQQEMPHLCVHACTQKQAQNNSSNQRCTSGP